MSISTVQQGRATIDMADALAQELKWLGKLDRQTF